MLTIGILSLILSSLFIEKKEIFFRFSLGILLYSLILSSQSFISNEKDDLGILGGLFHVNNLINGIEIYIYLLSLLLLFLIGDNNQLKILSSEYFIIILFSLLGMITLICSYDLISTFLAIEFQSFSLYILTTLSRKEAIAAGLKYYLLGSLSSAIFLIGLVLVYSITGVTQYDSLFSLLNVSYSSESLSFLALFAILFILVGLLFKIGAAPFHNWAPDVYDGVPTIITSWIAIMGKVSILIYLLNILYIIPFDSLSEEKTITKTITLILAVSALLSLIIGSLLGLVQHRIKRLLAYSSISHLGFILLALTTSNSVLTGLTSFLFYMFQYWISFICTFAIFLSLGRKIDLQYITFLKGLFQLNPILTFALIINLFSLTGIPPLIGFFGKQMIIYTSLLNGYYLVSIVAILTSVISAAYYLRIVKTAIFDFDPIYNIKYTFGEYLIYNNNSLSFTSWIISILTLFTFFFFLNPTIILDFIHLLALSIYLS